MYKKKLTYSLFSLPIAVFSYHTYQWQRRRASEKENETLIMKEKIFQNPLEFKYNPKTNFPWLNLNKKEFNEKFAYTPFILSGYFDHSQQILVKTPRLGEEGFEIITPFYCYQDGNTVQAVLVNRGWIPKDFKETKHHWAGFTGDIKIIGVLYKGDNSFKYSEENDIMNENWNNINPELIAAYLNLKNKDVASKFIVRQIEYDVTTKNPFPRIFNVGEATNWQVSVGDHNQVAKVWKYATFLNIFSNLFFWLYL